MCLFVNFTYNVKKIWFHSREHVVVIHKKITKDSIKLEHVKRCFLNKFVVGSENP